MLEEGRDSPWFSSLAYEDFLPIAYVFSGKVQAAKRP
jgi:hypothetical protein